MSVSRTEAAEALRDITRTERRSFSAYGYKAGAPQLILWGFLWFAGYGGTYLAPGYAAWIWVLVGAAGSILSAILGMRAKPQRTPAFSWPILFTWLAALGAIASMLVLFYPFSGMQIGSLFPLLIGWAYVILGIWMGGRFSTAGLAVVALTLFGFFYLSPHAFLLWMAFLGGALLIGTGLWLRQA